MNKEQVNALIDELTFTRSKTLRGILVDSYVKKYGEIPKDYRDAVSAVIEVYGGKEHE